MHGRLDAVMSRLSVGLARVLFSHEAYGGSPPPSVQQYNKCLVYYAAHFTPTFVTAQQPIISLHSVMLLTALWSGLSLLAYVSHTR